MVCGAKCVLERIEEYLDEYFRIEEIQTVMPLVENECLSTSTSPTKMTIQLHKALKIYSSFSKREDCLSVQESLENIWNLGNICLGCYRILLKNM